MDLLWLLLNSVQVVFAGLWSAFWISVALIVCALARSRRPGLALARRVWAPGILKAVGARLEVTGLERLDRSQPCFFAANHQSWIDIPALFAALPMPVLFVAKRELGRVPFLGWFLKAMGMVLVDRADRKGAARSVAAAAQRLRQGWSLLSFPEGTRSRDGRLQGFKTATFAAAIEAGAPVVPIALAGAGRVLPRGSLRTRPGRIRIAIGEPILTAGLTRDQRADLARRARGAVESLLAGQRGGTFSALDAATEPVPSS